MLAATCICYLVMAALCTLISMYCYKCISENRPYVTQKGSVGIESFEPIMYYYQRIILYLNSLKLHAELSPSDQFSVAIGLPYNWNILKLHHNIRLFIYKTLVIINEWKLCQIPSVKCGLWCIWTGSPKCNCNQTPVWHICMIIRNVCRYFAAFFECSALYHSAVRTRQGCLQTPWLHSCLLVHLVYI